jgi:hypothetical protein
MPIASVRILRMALGTALSLWVSQVGGWSMSFVMPIFTMFLLALPQPAPRLVGGIKFVLALVLAVYAGLLLLPLLVHMRWVGVLLLTLALFGSFYFTASGGSAVLGMFMTVGLTIAAAVGSVTIEGALAVAQGMTIGAVFGLAMVWVAHALLPDPPPDPAAAPPAPPPAAPKPAAAAARRSAIRSLVIVLPLTLWLLMSSASASYVAVMIKVASMGQQASVAKTRADARSLLVSTVIGGLGAIVAWQVLRIWPSLTLYCLLIGLAGLLLGPRIFAGKGMHPDGATWSYGYLTLIVVLAPAVLDGMAGGSADSRFWQRLLMFVGATAYGVSAVYVFDAFWPAEGGSSKRENPNVAGERTTA